MAKGKHSAALFEVIKGTGAGRSSGVSQSLLTPKWWFKTRPATPAPVEASPSFSEGGHSGASATVAAPPQVSRPAIPYANSARSSAIHLDFDRTRKEIMLRLRYTTALVWAFGVCALIGSAYVIGRHLNRGPQTASAATAATTAPQYVRQAPQTGVVDATRQRLLHPGTTETAAKRSSEGVTAVVTPVRASVSTSLVAASAETRLPRTIGLNYVVIQTYPNEEMQTAQGTCDFLTKNGIPCTLEKTDFARNWICLVGTAGFSKISSADFKAYVENIVRIGEKFPSSHFDHIRPAAYKWKAPEQ